MWCLIWTFYLNLSSKINYEDALFYDKRPSPLPKTQSITYAALISKVIFLTFNSVSQKTELFNTKMYPHARTHTVMHHEWFSLKTLHNTFCFPKCALIMPCKKGNIREKFIYESFLDEWYRNGKEITDVTAMIFEHRKEMVVIEIKISSPLESCKTITRKCQVKIKLDTVSIKTFL